jgi:hypothetical protein
MNPLNFDVSIFGGKSLFILPHLKINVLIISSVLSKSVSHGGEAK